MNFKLGAYGTHPFEGHFEKIQLKNNKNNVKVEIPKNYIDLLFNLQNKQVQQDQGYQLFSQLNENLEEKTLTIILTNSLDNLFQHSVKSQEVQEKLFSYITNLKKKGKLLLIYENYQMESADLEEFNIHGNEIVKTPDLQRLTDYINNDIQLTPKNLEYSNFLFGNHQMLVEFPFQNDKKIDFEFGVTNLLNYTKTFYSTLNDMKQVPIQISQGFNFQNQKVIQLLLKNIDDGVYNIEYRTKCEGQLWSEFELMKIKNVCSKSIQQDLVQEIICKTGEEIKLIINQTLQNLENLQMKQDYQDLGIQKINFAFFGNKGVGKSSTINSLVKAVGGIVEQKIGNGMGICTKNIKEISAFNKIKVFNAYDTAGYESQGKQKDQTTIQSIEQTQYGHKHLKYLLQGRLTKNCNLSFLQGDMEDVCSVKPGIFDKIHVIVLVVNITNPNYELIKDFYSTISQIQDGLYTPIIILTKCDVCLQQQSNLNYDYNMTDIYVNHQLEFKSFYDEFIKNLKDHGLNDISEENIFPFINLKTGSSINDNNLYLKFISMKILEKVYQFGQINIESTIKNNWLVKLKNCNEAQYKCIGIIPKHFMGESAKITDINQDIHKLLRESPLFPQSNSISWCYLDNQQNFLRKQDNIAVKNIIVNQNEIIIRIQQQQEEELSKPVFFEHVNYTQNLDTTIGSQNEAIDCYLDKITQLQSKIQLQDVVLRFKLDNISDFKNENQFQDEIKNNIAQQYKYIWKDVKMTLDQYALKDIIQGFNEEELTLNEYFQQIYSQNKQIEFFFSKIEINLLNEYQTINLWINERLKYTELKKLISKTLKVDNFEFYQFLGSVTMDEDADLGDITDFVQFDPDENSDILEFTYEQLKSTNRIGVPGLIIFEI